MATKNAINSSFPIEPAAGGTLAITLLDHGVLVGAGTGAVNAISVGSTGELIVGDTGSAPSFGVNATGDFTFQSSTAGGTRILKVENTDNTNAASSGLLSISSGGSSAGDASLGHIVSGVTTFSQGIDNSDSDKYKISASSALGTTDILESTVAGEIIKPLTSAFGIVGTDALNVTGAGTLYTIVASSEYFDQNSDFDGTSTFTAPVAGKYIFNYCITYSGIGIEPYANVRIDTTDLVYSNHVLNCSSAKDANNKLTIKCTVIAKMDAADTAIMRAYVWSTGSDTVDIVGAETFFSGYLAC